MQFSPWALLPGAPEQRSPTVDRPPVRREVLRSSLVIDMQGTAALELPPEAPRNRPVAVAPGVLPYEPEPQSPRSNAESSSIQSGRSRQYYDRRARRDFELYMTTRSDSTSSSGTPPHWVEGVGIVPAAEYRARYDPTYPHRDEINRHGVDVVPRPEQLYRQYEEMREAGLYTAMPTLAPWPTGAHEVPSSSEAVVRYVDDLAVLTPPRFPPLATDSEIEEADEEINHAIASAAAFLSRNGIEVPLEQLSDARIDLKCSKPILGASFRSRFVIFPLRCGFWVLDC